MMNRPPHHPPLASRSESARVRRGARRRPVGGRRLLGALLVVLLASGAVRLLHQPLSGTLTRVRRVVIEIDGPGVLREGEVLGALGLPRECAWSALETSALEARVRALPRVGAVAFEFQPTGTLRVRVAERAPVAMLICGDGDVRELAVDGFLLAPCRTVADLPLFTCDGSDAGQLPAVGERFDRAGAPDLLAVLARLRDEAPVLWQEISEAHLHPDGSYEIFWSDRPLVAWGRGPLSPARLRSWRAVMEDLRRRGECDAVIDLRFREQIVVRFPPDCSGELS